MTSDHAIVHHENHPLDIIARDVRIVQMQARLQRPLTPYEIEFFIDGKHALN